MLPAGWTICFSAFGVQVRLVVEHQCVPGGCAFPELAHLPDGILPPGAHITEPSPSQPSPVTLTVRCGPGRTATICGGVDDGRGDQPFDSWDGLHHALDGAIRAAVAVHAPGLVFVHAGVVALGGRAVILPGRSLAGKSTLVAALVGAGATYLSDEYAVLDGGELVHPYARPISLREAQGRRHVAAADLGGEAATRPHPVALVASLRYVPGGVWEVVPIGQAATAEALLANAVAAQHRPEEVLAATASIARVAPGVAGTRGDTSDAVARVVRLLDR